MKTNNDHGRPDRVALGVSLVLLSTLLTSLAEVTFRYASGEGLVWQYFFWRSLLSVPVLLAIAFVWGEGAATVLQALRPWPLVRSLLFVLMFITVYAALPFIPLATLAAGLYTSPLFVAALSPLVTGEPVRWRGWFAIALGFSGVLLILQPGTGSFTWLALLPVAGGLCYALSALLTRSKCRAVPPATLGVSMNLAMVAVSAMVSVALLVLEPPARIVALSPFLLGSWQVFGATEWFYVGVLTLLMVANSLIVSAAYQAAPSAIIVTFDYNYLIFMTLFGFAFFAETPNLLTVAGMVLIAGAGMTVMRSAGHKKNATGR